jgi:hypothetical protein
LPWPMVHFAISEILSNGDPSPNLLLGSIAPDAIHMRGQVAREEKGVTHLVHNDKLPAKSLIMEKFKDYLPMRSEPEWNDFLVGYFSHIYTDVRWTDTIYADFDKDYKGERDQIRKIYNQEVSQAEFNLLRSMNHSEEIFSLLLRAEGYTIDPFVTQLEVNQYRDSKVKWLQDFHNEPQIKPIYFQTDKIKSFIIETSKELKDLFKDWNIEYFKEDQNVI